MDTAIWVAIIGVAGTIIGAVIPWLLGRKSTARTETYDKVTGSFDQPQPNEAVGRTIRCSGIVTGLQPGLNLWLAVEVGNLVWPKENKVLPDVTNKWCVHIFEDGVTEQFALSLFVADTSADRRIQEWLEAGRRTGTCPSRRNRSL